MKRILRKTGIWVGSIAMIWLLAATALALSPAPKLSHPPPHRPEPSSHTSRGGPCHDGAGIAAFKCETEPCWPDASSPRTAG